MFINSIKLQFWSRLAKLSWRPFGEARDFVHTLGLKGRDEWEAYSKGKLLGKGRKPEDIPFKPQRTYKNEGWINWGNWLGTGIIATQLRNYRIFEDARSFVRKLRLKSSTEWRKYCEGKLQDKGSKRLF
jgi:hypothetical protein